MGRHKVLLLLLLAEVFAAGCDKAARKEEFILTKNRTSHRPDDMLNEKAFSRGYQKGKATLSTKPLIKPEKLLQQAIINFGLGGGDFEIRTLFSRYPEETIEQLRIEASNNLDSSLSALLGELLGKAKGGSGEEWIKEHLTGFVREYARYGYGRELMAADMETFKDYVSKMPLNNTRDVLLAEGISRLSETNLMDAYHLLSQEFAAMAAGTSPALGAISTKLTYKMVNELTETNLRDIISEPTFVALSQPNKESIACIISEKYPSLAISWASDKHLNASTKEQLLLNLSRVETEKYDNDDN